ncbi:MJ0042-type zinc finger domain-containing protein [Maioricimonas sp. JC845]|uniref:MJ0042-type zinc finger domain-containing protein n=1 Tax=Maioricimonas sp. JC845 TaxID=3232138 RepID=UPI003458FBD0
MSQVCQCPQCSARLRIPDAKRGQAVKCPKCGTRFRAGQEPQDELDEPWLDDDLSADDYGELPDVPQRKAKKKTRRSGDLQPFLRQWLTACGVIAAVTILLAIGGLFSEPVAIAATAICVVWSIGCVLGGHIWIAIDLGKESALKAIAAMFVPFYALATSMQKRPPMKGGIVIVSVVAPTILLGLMLLVFRPMYVGDAKQAARARNWKSMIHRMESNTPADAPVVTARFRVASRPGSLDNLQPRCEQLLSQFDSYVPGSLQIDAANRIIGYQYRGPKQFDRLFAMYLGSETKAFIPQAPVEQQQP